MISNQQLTKKLQQAKPELHIDPAFTARVMEKIEALPAPHHHRIWRTWRMWAPVTTAALLLLVSIPLLHTKPAPHRNDASRTTAIQQTKRPGLKNANSSMGHLPPSQPAAQSTSTPNPRPNYQQLTAKAQSDSSAISQQTQAFNSLDYVSSKLSNTAIAL